MEKRQFDALARLDSATRTRRGALAALLGGALLGRALAAAPAGGRKPRRKHRHERRGGNA